MKKNDFDNRLQNDLFPEMPASFESGLKKAMEHEGVRTKKRPTATGVFAGAVSLLAAAACLLIVLIGVMGGGRSGKSHAAAPGEASDTPPMAQSTPGITEAPYTWDWNPKIITLSTGFEFENVEKFQALYTGILSFLKERGESEPDELWLCAIRNRFVKDDTGIRADEYLSGYYVLAQHSFGGTDGPELYCLTEDFDVLWATEGSSRGPNHAVRPAEDSAARYGHFLYGMALTDAHVTRGALVGTEPGTDIEFSMASSIAQVQERLAGSAHLEEAREYFLITVSANDWDGVMENPILRFETLEGPVDLNLEADVPLVHTLTYAQLHSGGASPTPLSGEYGVEHWLSQNQPLILDLTDDWYGAEIVQQYAEAIRRALLTDGEHISVGGIWICGVTYDWEYEDGRPPENAYVLALNAGDGEPSPELFYYQGGRILWRTQGADTERVNVVYHNGNTVVFGKSPAFDNRPLAMTYGKIVLENGSDQLAPVLTLDEIRERITGEPYYSSARECYLWMDCAEHQVSRVIVAAKVNSRDREFSLNKVNVLEPQNVPAMAVESNGVVYPGMVTVLAQSLDENGVAAEGEPLGEIVANGLLFKGKYVWQRPLTILTASDAVSVDSVSVFGVDSGEAGQLQLDGEDLDLREIDALSPGDYYLCFRTTALGPYSETAGRYTFTTNYTIYKVTLE